MVEVRDVEDGKNHLFNAIISGGPSKVFYKALTARNPKSVNPAVKELAKWKQSAEGFPCTLIRAKTERQFEDRESLERGLADLLKDPGVGEILLSLTQMN